MISNRVIHALIAAVVSVGGMGTAVGGERSPVQDAIAEIDRIVSSAITAKGLQPAPRCSDETYLRRVTLDLAGRIPTPDEYRMFLQNPNRAQLVDRLLESEDFTRFWSEWLTTATIGSGRPFGVDREILRAWFERMLRERVPYDEVVRRILTAEGNSALDGPVNFWIRYPEQPATKVSRLFLGVRLGCARCHDHPFDRWKRIDFDRFNRFFAGVRREEVSEGTIRIREELMEADGDDLPRFLTGAKPRGRLWRPQLALYLTRSKPFARAYVNRLWYHFLGRGIVHPVDDFQRENAPAIPELLEFLRREAVERRFQWRPLIRMICLSEAYQRVSDGSGDETELRFFARFPLKPLTPEQLYDSYHVALGRPIDRVARRTALQRISSRSVDEDFVALWESRETAQDLLRQLAAPLNAPTGDIDALFVRSLSRLPTDDERATCGDASPSDVMFALLHGAEFAFNH